MRATTCLILLLIISFFFLVFYPFEQEFIEKNLAFSGNSFKEGRIWVLVSSIFVHANQLHLILNLLALFFFGYALEEKMSGAKIFALFFLGGIAGNLMSLVFYPPEQLCVGASGAIFAIMGAAILIKPFEFIFFPTLIPVPIALIGIIYAISTIFSLIIANPESNIAHAAHFGGLLIGISYGFHREGVSKGLLIIAVFFLFILLIPQILMLALGLTSYTQLLNYFLGK